MRHQNIAIITNIFPPDQVGGAGIVAEAQAKELVEQGRGVHVFTLAGPKVKAKKHQINGYTVYKLRSYNVARFGELGLLPTWKNRLWHLVDMTNIALAWRIAHSCKKKRIRHAMTHNTLGMSGLLPLFLSIMKIEHTHVVHDVQFVEPSGTLPWNHTKDSLLQKLYALYKRIMFASASEVLYPSSYMKKFYTKRRFFRNARTELLYMDVQSRLPVLPKKPHTDIQFLYVGELAEHKGVKMLISLWPRVMREHSLAKFDIVGDGALAPFAKALSMGNKRVMYYGKQQGDALAARYASADIVLFSSMCIENRPNVLVEAMAAGCHIIATKTGGVPELLADYDAAFLVEPGSEEAMVRAIAWAIHQRQERTHTPKSGRRR